MHFLSVRNRMEIYKNKNQEFANIFRKSFYIVLQGCKPEISNAPFANIANSNRIPVSLHFATDEHRLSQR